MSLDLIIICTFGFIAAMVDAIAGGGGLISLPALLMVGLPPHFALGTNKFAASLASLNSSITFARSGKVHFPLVKWQIPFSLLGAFLGAWAVLGVSSDFLNKAVLFLILFVGIYTLVRKNLGMENNFKGLSSSKIVMGCLLAMFLGFYDGFFGPGTGSFLIFSFITLFGFDFVSSSANSKVLNFSSNISSLIFFAWNGKILYSIGIPMALFMILGSYAGTRLAIHHGPELVRPLFVIMSILVAAKLIFQFL
ncbi:TSUP family transporter [Desulfosporosinus youngiae]|uniref:Probable membrane transporter protein n=1 Tax=Desulfosporosinus youngiae DSM 17734 TaxID=768710 RepID=H5XVT9_9FIRM|nr:TSUP family transporter [Desulfosporosinus youngiae]EHQ90245.1 putative permease [Desulfosporosinus youngiae DSM 17734]